MCEDISFTVTHIPTFAVLLGFAIFQLCNGQSPAPIAVPITNSWAGYDGLWSPVGIKVGTPPQWLSVFPNTASQETWVIGPGGCDGTALCEQKRGGIFYADQSSTQSDLGYYELFFDTQLGDTGYADYILDDIALSGRRVVPGQVVGILNTTEFCLGELGLGVDPIQFNGSTNHLTFLSSLVENVSLIPSHSYGYTAGAYYRPKNTPTSLTLGGVDTNRFVPNSASFVLGPNLQPIVAVNSIKVSADPVSSATNPPSWSNRSLTLFEAIQTESFTIDSSTPFLWLPQPACENFANALNLTYNETLQLYVFNDSTAPSDLQSWNMTFTFSISDFLGSSNLVDITLPYDSFNLQLTFPFPGLDASFGSAPVNYFPLRQASSIAQYTIGRFFLQEAYLTVDYERNNFSVSQAVFPLDPLNRMNLVPITRPANSNFTGPQVATKPVSGTAVKTGIGIAAGALLIALGAFVWYYFFFRKRKLLNDTKLAEKANPTPSVQEDPFSDGLYPELPGDNRHPFSELPADRRHPVEAAGDHPGARFELAGSLPIEMPAADVPESFYDGNSSTRRTFASAKNDPERPAELETSVRDMRTVQPHQNDIAKSPVSSTCFSAEQRGNFSDSISPTTPRHTGNGFGTTASVSSGRLVSPIESRGPEHSRSPSTEKKPILSPLSPTVAAFPSKRPDHPSSQRRRTLPRNPDDGGAPLLSERSLKVVSRSPSQSSRVHDEQDGMELMERALQVPSPARTSRFSWE